MWSDEAVVRYISRSPSNEEESWSRFLKYAGHWYNEGYGFWLIERRSDGRFVGEAGFANHKREMTPSLRDRPEIGYVLCSDMHGMGIASEVSTMILSWADLHLSRHASTVCLVDPDHLKSIRVAEKVGYVRAHTTIYRDEPTLVLERFRARDR